MKVRDNTVVSIGECMVELSRQPDGNFALAVGGDTYNTAIYLARLGINVAYLTAVGDDPYSARIIETARREGIQTDGILRQANRMPGLYLIETDAGERSFWYWRETSPARELLDLPDAHKTLVQILAADWIYLSGITLSLYSSRGLDSLAEALIGARNRGAKVVMDSNFRPRGWPEGTSRAQHEFERFWQMTDIALPTFDDEQNLWGDDTPLATIERLAGLGISEICVKNGSKPATVYADGQTCTIECPTTLTPVDTTAAGDSFNAAYLGARVQGRIPSDAAVAGHRLAGIVIVHRGAIAPLQAMASINL